jgi:lysyl-tRNA synthetase class II
MKGDLNMPLLESKKINNTSVESRTLSNVQMELIKLYSTDLEYNDLMEVKKILANHFAQKAINEADNIWNQKKMSADTMEDWLNEN